MRILLVEDDPEQLEPLHTALSEAGHILTLPALKRRGFSRFSAVFAGFPTVRRLLASRHGSWTPPTRDR